MPYRKSSTRKRKKQKRVTRRFSFISLFTLTGFIVLIVLLQLDFWRIQDVNVQGADILDTQEILNYTLDAMDEKRLLVIPENHILLFDKGSLKLNLQNNFPDIESVEIRRSALDGIDVTILERSPAYNICSGQECFYADATGFLFRENIVELASADTVYTSYRTYGIKDQYLSQGVLDELQVLVESLAQQRLSINSVHEYSEFSIILQTQGGTRIIIPRDSSYDGLYSTMVKMFNVEQFAINKEQQDFIADIAYINLGFGNKIFYCETGVECSGNYSITQKVHVLEEE